MPVNTHHMEYQKHYPSWQKVRDCVEGSEAVKEKTTIYLPKPSERVSDPERYKNYIKRAVFYNVTARTLYGLSGAVFRKPPVIELPKRLEYLTWDADGNGLSISQSAKRTLDDVLQIGRAGLFVEFPTTSSPVTLAEEEAFNLRSTIIHYSAESIINWNTTRIGASSILNLVVLKEEDCIYLDMYEKSTVWNYRVLALDEEGNYYQEIWRESGQVKGKEIMLIQVSERIYPRDGNGNLLKEIPFIFIGSENLNPCIDKAPLLDLAELNLAHYRNSADYEEMVYMTGQPTLIFTGITQSWNDEVLKKGIEVGSKGFIPLPQGADAKFLQLSANGLSSEAMQQKEAQMIALGARIVVNLTAGVEAAETVRLRQGGESSMLANIADNVSEGYRKALDYACLFMNADDNEVKFLLNRDFFDETLDPQEAESVIKLWQSGAIAKSDLRSYLRKGEMLREDRTDEEIDQELESESMNIPTINLD